MPAKRVSERNLKMKLKNSIYLPVSKLKKIFYRSERQTGRKAIRARPVWTEEMQDRFQEIKIQRRLTQAANGRAMDIMNIKDQVTRRELHKAAQKLINSTKTELDSDIFKRRVRELLGDKTVNYLEILEQSSNKNYQQYY